MKRYKDQRRKILSAERRKSRQAKSIKVGTPQKMQETYNKNKDRLNSHRIKQQLYVKPEDPTITTEDIRKLVNSIR